MDNMQIYSSENTNPWIGLDSYKEGQTLYGRSREIQDLSMAVFYNRHTVVYGRSGIGKSSLLHAGIFPEARRRGCLPISIRFDHSAKIGYREQLICSIVDAVIANGGEVKDLTGKDTKPYSLWEFFHCYQLKRGEETITPLIVIDQFEEIFTLGRNHMQVKDFFEELADLLNDIKPAYLQTTSEQVAQNSSGSLFDNLNIQISDERHEQEMSFHLVFVLREDYLSYLERYSLRIPPLKQNRFGLLPITYWQAMEIITKPREGLVTNEVADSIIRHIVTENDITDETPVDSAILSLFLNRLYEKKNDASAITRQLVNDYGNALLEDFYAEIVNPLDRRTIYYLEDTLINSDGHRENVSLESLYRNNHIKRSVIEILEHNHLLRIFSYGDVQRVEFAHDVLCPIIMRRRTQRQYAERTRRTKRIGLGAFFGLLLLLFGGMYIIAERLDQKEALARQQEQLSEMEVSLIEKGTKNMLDEKDTYGAIRLLLNSMGNEKDPSPSTARMEKVLRQAVDSLAISDSYCVAKVQYKATILDKVIISPSNRLIAIGGNTSSGVVIDSYTGSIVQTFYNQAASAHTEPHGKFGVYNGRIVYERRFTINKENKLVMEDIHPSDTRCLIKINNTILDCYIKGALYDNDNGNTRLCLHDFDKTINTAAYSQDGSKIAINFNDDSYCVYDANSGKECNSSDSLLAKKSIEKVQQRNLYHDIRRYHSRARSKTRLRTFDFWENFCIQGDRSDNIKANYSTSGIAHLYIPSFEIDERMRNILDSLGDDLPKFIETYSHSYYYQNDTIGSRFYWPQAVSPKENRMVILNPIANNAKSELYGLYPHNGAVFFHTKIPNEVHTLHFTEDDQYLVVNAGENTQEVIYLPPLETLLDSCKNMFFDWQMTEEERYQTYIHMND